MEPRINEINYHVVKSDKFIIYPQQNNFICCCISEKWCFEHSGIPAFNYYDQNINNICLYLDCCSWCLEFKLSKKKYCNDKDTICYLCFCSIYFI